MHSLILCMCFLCSVQFLEIPGNLKDSQLHVWPSQYKAVPKAFAWLTGAGIYYGKLGFGDHEAGESLFLEKTLIPYSSEQHSEFTPPVGMALTQFHCILLYRDRLVNIKGGRALLNVCHMTQGGSHMCVEPKESV